MIQRLIQRNEPEDIERIRFLAEIPAVSTLLPFNLNSESYWPSTGYANNSLLRSAMRVGNTQASALLLENPNVLRIAQADNFYANDGNNQLDIAAILADSESSIQAFSVDEKRLLDEIKTHYASKTNGQTDTLVQKLQQVMIEEYEKDPAFYTDKQTKTTLPLSWDEFNNLGLTGKNREKALIAYRTHAAHSAYRFLLDPNPFMASNAAWAQRNDDGSLTACYHPSKPLLATLYLLMMDDSYDTEDTTYNSPTIRRNIAADCLYEMMRAHNKEDRNNSRKIIHYTKEGDKPSCSMGMPRRLFYCLNRIGEAMHHPVFMKKISAFKVNIECNEFLQAHVKTYFEEHDTGGNFSNALNLFLNGDGENAYDLEELPDNGESLLRNSNVPQKEVEMFIRRLAKKYGSAFTLTKQAAVRDYFKLDDSSDELHITKYWDDIKANTWYKKPTCGGASKPM